MEWQVTMVATEVQIRSRRPAIGVGVARLEMLARFCGGEAVAAIKSSAGRWRPVDGEMQRAPVEQRSWRR